MVRDAFGGLLAAMLIVSPASAQLDEQSGAQVREEVAALVQRWSDAGEAGDWPVVLDTYADEPAFAWIEQGEARYISRSDIAAGLNRARTMNAQIRNDVSDIVVTPLSCDLAAFRTAYLLDVNAKGFRYRSSGIISGVAV